MPFFVSPFLRVQIRFDSGRSEPVSGFPPVSQTLPTNIGSKRKSPGSLAFQISVLSTNFRCHELIARPHVASPRLYLNCH